MKKQRKKWTTKYKDLGDGINIEREGCDRASIRVTSKMNAPWALAHRIARLLNEDDARKAKKRRKQ